MSSHTISSALLVAAMAAALTAPDDWTPPPSSGAAEADTVAVEADWLAEVTMDPIRVVMTRDARLESVTMEPIRVMIPRPAGASPDARKAPRR